MMKNIFLLFTLLLVLRGDTAAFVLPNASPLSSDGISSSRSSSSLKLELGEYSINLEKPLGMILEERDGENSGVVVRTVLKDDEAAGSAWKTGRIAPGEILLKKDGVDVSSSSFERVMEMLVKSESSTTKLVMGDALGRFDMPPNVLKRLASPEDAFFVDAVVREAVRAIRRDGRLGDLLQVEVIVGAGINNEKRGMVRFFAIFSTDGVSTYSCNVSATGVRNDSTSNDSIQIVSLSCAKDEGLGRTYDLIQEKEEV
ncbi:unnamed protein product [Pseudo-nitzschia multistriata]|uniref:PDZ domain-containing protein n=1 Tax=Pseudo-nitzschia multistriata TaxID=183589 RepID=A0A448YZZ4_9STRA|nr:unnamed protein product [Pseudo-nitzschia multistriata]